MGMYRFRIEGQIEANSDEQAAAFANAVLMKHLNREAVPPVVLEMLETLNPQFHVESVQIGDYHDVDSRPETE